MKRKYLAGQKLSDAKVESILRGFAHGMSATAYIRWSQENTKSPPSPKTVFKIYTLVRRRLSGLNVFPAPELYFKIWAAPENREKFHERNMPARIGLMLRRYRTIRNSNRYPILAEAIFRAEYMHENGERMLRSIKEVVKITGPLNRPGGNFEVWHQWNRIRNEERVQLEARRAGLPASYFNPEDSLQERLMELKRMLRKGHRLKAQRAPRRRPKVAQPRSDVHKDDSDGHA